MGFKSAFKGLKAETCRRFDQQNERLTQHISAVMITYMFGDTGTNTQ